MPSTATKVLTVGTRPTSTWLLTLRFYIKALRVASSRKNSALTFGVRFCVLKSTCASRRSAPTWLGARRPPQIYCVLSVRLRGSTTLVANVGPSPRGGLTPDSRFGFHPLLLFNEEGDCLAAKLRPGNVHSAEGWEELLLPEIERPQQREKEVAFRGDAAFARPEVYERWKSEA